MYDYYRKQKDTVKSILRSLIDAYFLLVATINISTITSFSIYTYRFTYMYSRLLAYMQ